MSTAFITVTNILTTLGTTTSTYLLNGGNKAEGKVLMKLQPGVTDAKPYILCDDSWDKENADVICRQAGYHSAVMATSSSYFGVHDPEDEANFGGVEFLADRINCEGSERNVVVCPADDLPDGECDTGHEAGVSCNRIEGTVINEYPIQTNNHPSNSLWLLSAIKNH